MTDRLATGLDALSNPVRLAIVRQLRLPRALREIEARSSEEGERAVPISRQSVRWHLDRLLATGLVSAKSAERDYGETTEFVVNHQSVFSLAEDIRGLARMRPSIEPEAVTAPAAAAVPAARPAGPRLILVRGLDEGTTFDLTPDADRAQWTIGRKRSTDVALDFDSTVSGLNSVVTWNGSAHEIEDAGGSRNGTVHNFRRLRAGERVTLRHGDVIGVGRCLLLYWQT